MKKDKQKLTLYQPALYEIKVPGLIDESWSAWTERMTITVESEDDDSRITALTVLMDQAALHGLLKLLYSHGIPLISVVCKEVGDEGKTNRI